MMIPHLPSWVCWAGLRHRKAAYFFFFFLDVSRFRLHGSLIAWRFPAVRGCHRLGIVSEDRVTWVRSWCAPWRSLVERMHSDLGRVRCLCWNCMLCRLKGMKSRFAWSVQGRSRGENCRVVPMRGRGHRLPRNPQCALNPKQYQLRLASTLGAFSFSSNVSEQYSG